MNVHRIVNRFLLIALEKTMKRNGKKNLTKAVTATLPKKNHWSLGLLDSMKDPTLKVVEDDSIVVIKDKYPKARFHYLILPKENISTVWKIQKNHENLLWHMDDVAEELIKKHSGHKFLIGYHAVPSMQRMHLHVISTDFNSPCLKTKYHWNSFTTPFFISSKELCKQLKENGELKKISSTTAQKYLNSELKCHECSVKPKNMGDLKRHLLSSHLSEKRE
ncbi:aprataxin-like [Vespula maculifrons]|uniref:Aprataxin-like n=1 Tax=Vespula maculifrons TaxID=7453 RepID=A0ABD2CWZ1_VESMC